MNSNQLRWLPLILTVTLGFTSSVFAQEKKEDVIPNQPKELIAEKKVSGWTRSLTIGLVGQYAESDNVPGKPDGQSSTLGSKDNAKMYWSQGDQEWRNDLSLLYTNSRSSALPRMVKTDDELKIESIYLYHIPALPRVGPFVRGNLNTPMTNGYDERAQDVTYSILHKDGTAETVVDDRLKLSDAWRPLTAKLSTGGFVNLYQSEPLAAEYRLGIGYRHFAANNQLSLKDDPTTPVVEVVEIETTKQFGLETGLTLFGSVVEKKITYKLNSEVLIPYWKRPKPLLDDKSPMELKITEVSFDLSFHLLPSLSLDYVMKSIRDPSVNDKAQTSHSLLGNLSYQFEG